MTNKQETVQPLPSLLCAREAAQFLRIRLPTLYTWVHQRRIPYRKHGKKLVFSHRDLEEWSQQNGVDPLSGLTPKGTKGLIDPYFRPRNGARSLKIRQSVDGAPRLGKES